jgi:galactokinase
MLAQQASAVAPGRVNLIGEHLDYNGGTCLPIAIPLLTRADVALAANGTTSCVSDDAQAGWQKYPLGVLDALGVETHLTISIRSELPTGAGLSSSAALLCSIGVAVNELLDLRLDKSQLIEATIRAETEFVGAPTGGLDQTVVMLAEAGHALEVNVERGTVNQHALDLVGLGVDLLVINTHVQHDHLTGDYGNRRAECERARDLLEIDKLVDADPTDTRLSPLLRCRTKHVVSEERRVAQFISALAEGNVEKMGALMLASHRSLRDDFEVSCTALDVAVDAAMTAGAFGARMTGGGFGGCAIALVPANSNQVVRQRLIEAFGRSGLQTPDVFRVEAVRGAQVIAD